MQIKEMEAFTFKVEILPFAVWFSVVPYRIGLVVLHGLPLNLKFYSEVEHHSAEISKDPVICMMPMGQLVVQPFSCKSCDAVKCREADFSKLTLCLWVRTEESCLWSLIAQYSYY